MILIQQTIDKFGYNPAILMNNSSKVVVVACDICTAIKERRICDVARKPKFVCRECSLKQAVIRLSSESSKARRRQTLLNKFGVSSLGRIPGVQEKIKQTNLRKYGVPHISQSKDFQVKQMAKNLTKYGVPHFVQTDKFKDSSKKTCLSRYGVDNAMQSKDEYAKYKIENWLNSLGFNFKPDRKILNGLELDMYDKSVKLAIEYCGLYWHSEASPKPKNRTYHYDKYLKCKEKGIRLITIFEDEWLFRNSQVRNFIKSVLGKNTIMLMARKCSVKSIDLQEAKKFIETHHIQGASKIVKTAAGLIYNNELVGVMTFGRHPRNNNITVLDRLCFKNDVTISGGASKLFKFLLANLQGNQIISWSDSRWSLGKVYENLGFIRDGDLKPDYSYYNKSKGVRVSKQSQQKQNTNCPADKTEHSWAKAHNLFRIWDCGKIRWKFTKINK
jgi:hypothetical protein